MKINVTQDRIDRGETGECFDCAVALAIKEDYPESGLLAVGSGCVSFFSGYSLMNIPLPKEAQDWILASDRFEKCDANGNPLKPFSFELEFPAGA
jgi:hypothetical protein